MEPGAPEAQRKDRLASPQARARLVAELMRAWKGRQAFCMLSIMAFERLQHRVPIASTTLGLGFDHAEQWLLDAVSSQFWLQLRGLQFRIHTRGSLRGNVYQLFVEHRGRPGAPRVSASVVVWLVTLLRWRARLQRPGMNSTSLWFTNSHSRLSRVFREPRASGALIPHAGRCHSCTYAACEEPGTPDRAGHADVTGGSPV